jgi:hypothetical protein
VDSTGASSPTDGDESLVRPTTDPSSSPEPEEGETSDPSDESDSASPSWLEGTTPSDDPANDPSPDQPAGEDELGPADIDGTGIVGGTTEMGAGGASSDATRDGATAGAPSRAGRPSTTGGPGGSNRRIYVIGIAIGAVLLVLVGLGFGYFSSDDEDTTEPAATAGPPVTDTSTARAQSDTAEAEPERPPPANVSLGDTLHLTVVATGNVAGMRIQRDDDLRRPYWIEQGEARVFPFRRRVTVDNELADGRFLLEGYPFPVPDDTAATIEITRAQASSFVDTLRGTPASLSVSPDTIPVGQPQ